MPPDNRVPQDEDQITFKEYLLDHYGHCDRTAECYSGIDAFGRFNGCLKTGWKGRACKHWRPLGAETFDELRRKTAAHGASKT